MTRCVPELDLKILKALVILYSDSFGVISKHTSDHPGLSAYVWSICSFLLLNGISAQRAGGIWKSFAEQHLKDDEYDAM